MQHSSLVTLKFIQKGTAIQLQGRTGSEDSRRLPDLKTVAI